MYTKKSYKNIIDKIDLIKCAIRSDADKCLRARENVDTL